jgi:hypothetical protein
MKKIKQIKSELLKRSERKSQEFNVVVNVEGIEIDVLNDAFDYGDMKGLTGSSFRAVSQEEYNDSVDEDNIKDYLTDAGIDDVDDYYDSMDMTAIEETVFDFSYSSMWDEIRQATGFSEEEYPIFTCTGGGRMFSVGDVWNIRPDLQYLIDEYEGSSN